MRGGWSWGGWDREDGIGRVGWAGEVGWVVWGGREGGGVVGRLCVWEDYEHVYADTTLGSVYTSHKGTK